jgi:hypothetical protein
MAVSITDFGAVGDGDPANAALNQAAIQAAFDASNDIYFPGGNYHTLGLTVTHDNTKVRGEGDKCQLAYAASGTGALLDTANRIVDFDSFKLSGEDFTDKRFLTAPANARTGLRIGAQFNSRVRNLTVIGFGGAGVDEGTEYDGPADAQTRRLRLQDSFISDCGYGLRTAPSGACEYQAFSGLRLTRNAVAYCDRAGNVNATGLIIMDNGVGADLVGTEYANNSHGNLSNSLINHSVHYSVRIRGCTAGYNLVGNQIHLGNILVEDSVGVQIACGTIHVGELRFKGGGRGMVHHNFMLPSPENGLVNTVVHNSGGSADKMLLRDNWTPTGAFPDSQGAAA